MITLLSVNRSGTHFLLYLVLVQLGLDVRFNHFTSSFWRRLKEILADPPHPIIVLEPKRAGLEAVNEPEFAIQELFRVYAEHLPTLIAAGAIQFDIDDPATIDPVLAALGIARTPQIDNFINEWPVIGPGHPSARLDALRTKLTDAHRFWVGKPVLGDGL